ncbi:putative nicotinamide phosphoribosyl transferase [Pseudomonas phage vB_PpS_SYP]|nr:putative nicotinamide phosphoribosyl transferase [Pseudomonas phage vB_PpS_SYP]
MKKFDFVPQRLNLFAAFNTDAYKLGHADMYSEGSELVVNNLTPRSDKIYRRSCTRYYDGKLVFVGAQGAFMEIVANWNIFFTMKKEAAVELYSELVDNVLGAGVVSPDRIAQLHDVGYLPLEVKTLKEGSKVKMGIPVLTVKNTQKHAFWLPNFIETVLSNLTWKTSTNATTAAEYKAMLTDFAIKTGTPLELVNWQGHSFADRGMSGPEDAARSGFGHAALFLGSDSMGTIQYAQQYYFAGKFVSGSVPATEHAVTTSNILRIERALENAKYVFLSDEQAKIWVEMEQAEEDPRLIAEMMFLYELMQKYPTGILSYVTDSFDYYGVLTRGLPYLKDAIMARDGKLVIRPDSGDPVEVVCGQPVHHIDVDVGHRDMLSWFHEIAYKAIPEENREEDKSYKLIVKTKDGVYISVNVIGYQEYDGEIHLDAEDHILVERSAEEKGSVELLYDLFGGTITETGHKMLDSHIGLIYGDSITTTRCLNILQGLFDKGFASGNCVYGVGSFTYQCVTRDTFGFAVKATYTEVNGEGIEIFKDPKTDQKKKSAKGLLFVDKDEDGEYILIDQVSKEVESSHENQLVTRFKDGEFYNLISLDEIRSQL